MIHNILTHIIQFCTRERALLVLVTAVVIVYGWVCTQQVPIDAIPNIGENQVIVFTAWPGRSPKDIEDQVTYPLSVAMLAVPNAESVRGKSLFGGEFVLLGSLVETKWVERGDVVTIEQPGIGTAAARFV